MQPVDVDTLLRRVASLERRQRHLHVGAIVLMLALAAIAAMAQAPPSSPTVTAHEFVLVDHAGKVSAKLTAAPVGVRGSLFLDPEGYDLLHVSRTPEGYVTFSVTAGGPLGGNAISLSADEGDESRD